MGSLSILSYQSLKLRICTHKKYSSALKSSLWPVLGLYLSIKQKQQLVHFLLQSGCCQTSNKYRPTFEGRVLQISVMGPVISKDIQYYRSCALYKWWQTTAKVVCELESLDMSKHGKPHLNHFLMKSPIEFFGSLH